jgi:subtilisin family serine protease
MGQVRMQSAAATGTGAGVLVAVIDGGFDLRHEALAGRIDAAKWDFLDHDADPQDLGNGVDDDGDDLADSLVGHGTFTSSLVLAGAPDARVLPLRVLDDEGWGDPVAVAQALQYAIDHGARVINMSLVVPNTSAMVRDAVRAALDAGIVVVSSAGNDRTWQNDPQIARRVITVGAATPTGAMAPFSGSGPNVHVYAPGVDVRGAYGGANPDEYARWQGTSFSAPFVAATVAVIRGARPAASADKIRDAVMQSVVVMPDVEPSGRGLLQSGAACDRVQ